MKQIVIILAFLALTLSFQQEENTDDILRPCQAALEVYQNNLEYMKKTVEQKEFSVLTALNFRVKYTLLQVAEYCPVFYDDELQITSYQGRNQCPQSLVNLFTLSNVDVVSNYQEILEILEFQENNCWSYDYAGQSLNEVVLQLEKQENYLKKYQNIDNMWQLNNQGKGAKGGGVACIVCTVLLQAINDYVKVLGISAQQALDEQKTCEVFPVLLKQACNDIFDKQIGQTWVQMYEQGNNSDAMCSAFNTCSDQQCQLYSSKNKDKYQSGNEIQSDFQKYQNKLGGISILKLVGDINDLINKFADQHLPVLDLDNDYYSTFKTLRGWFWRGKDCNDLNKSIHPGRKSKAGLKGADFNCNGISGVEKDTGIPYETKYCEKSGQMGVLVLGDSAGAHFSLPPNWINGTSWNKNTFDGFWEKLSMELDNPNFSSGSGFVDETSVNSFYLNLLERNRCNRNDYQNLGVNGARSGAELKLEKAIARDQNNDHPVIVFWELIGNDVCSSIPSHMTEPEQFKQNILADWQYLDEQLPAGSHMVVTGVADGTILYECLEKRESPVGVLYPEFYNFLNCLEISPCAGWMNVDGEIRQQTTQRAKELNKMYKEIIAENTYKNFDIQYYDFPMDEIMEIVESQGGKCWDCIEAGDGFHPSQVAVSLWSDILWQKLDIDQPTWKGKINPYNDQIKKQFGEETVYIKKTAKFDYNQQILIEFQ
ncbi:hypothetical protein PPERSA_00962 [Pseudocohnilembus persalinus]|uniref:Saposin B-type domain-containing protein n=1 Tax=Pseudocohnilembus persalinus TaxID=266149 RepID=A0A0V0R9A3_PSEPJ|nr:hypothetical protein PPERSA_00962 [Pseudocohnilembus persalinus]|eukprot:KRX10792.1 hypothetical protein PPERSA_00962 [Pseudocohnilembus persalinus]